mmetsp:Transcript_34757/g.63234  ORF Transcript_34757/g.63234 Transcript_34757/m.63234 type:complete len:519 (+) Transcript_34757:38-1594(+)
MASSILKNLHLLEAHAVVALLREGRVTAMQLLEVAEKRIAATDSIVHATPITCFERARERIANMQHPSDPPLGYLYGLPVLVKDQEAVSGVRFTEGSPLYVNRVAQDSSPLVLQLEKKGAVVIGKTNVPEFCAGSQSFNPIFPTTVSPWDTRTTAGGSSGGSAAALASCQCWLATGSDLGGSLRTPASFCGVVGFRVSPGRVPRGEASGPWRSIHSVNGPMARSVRDVGLLLDAMDGNAGWSFSFAPLPQGETYEAAAILGASIARSEVKASAWKVGFSTLGCTVDPQQEKHSRRAAEILASMAPDSEPQLLELTNEVDFKMAERCFHVQRAQGFADKFRDMLADPETAKFVKPEILWNAEAGCAVAGTEADLAALEAQVMALFEHVDIVCAPMTLDAAFDAQVRYPTEQVGQKFSNYLEWMKPACIVTAMLCPAISLPAGFLEDGRPVGVQLIGPPGADAQVLVAAAAIEARLGVETCCPSPRAGSADLKTIGPRSVEEAAQHHEGAVERFAVQYRA